MNAMPTIEEVLREARAIAVVGLSNRPERPSHEVAAYLQAQGYRVIPVNPNLTGPVLGERPYPDLKAVPGHIDIVDIFRRPADVPPVVDEAIAQRVPVLWMQLGIVHEAAAAKACAAGTYVIMDRCIAIEHRALVRAGRLAARTAPRKDG